MQAKVFHKAICQSPDEAAWPLLYLHALVRAWWLAEYSGFYLDGDPDAAAEGVDADEGICELALLRRSNLIFRRGPTTNKAIHGRSSRWRF